MKSKEKEERDTIKEQQCRTFRKDVKLLRDIFFNKRTFAVLQKYLAGTAFVF